ncbi:hypothetical protein SLE2022_022220 [Rubroshorea leprosula]
MNHFSPAAVDSSDIIGSSSRRKVLNIPYVFGVFSSVYGGQTLPFTCIVYNKNSAPKTQVSPERYPLEGFSKSSRDTNLGVPNSFRIAQKCLTTLTSKS